MSAVMKGLPHWSMLAMLLRLKRMKNGQVGDGREQALVEYVVAHSAPGDLDGAIEAIDEFAYRKSFLINVGDEKGAILEAAVGKARPARLLELGTYCGYSALRIVRAMPADARLWTVERSAANAVVANRIWQHAGVADRVTCVVGMLGDNGSTIRQLREEHGFAPANLDFVFIDHVKNEYLPDLERILDEGWLHFGSIVVADNIKVPGAPAYRTFMRDSEGVGWRTTEHAAHVEYQRLIPDLILESEYRPGETANGQIGRIRLKQAETVRRDDLREPNPQ